MIFLFYSKFTKLVVEFNLTTGIGAKSYYAFNKHSI